MTTKLSLYNGALRFLGKPSLASLTESNEARRLLDEVWDEDARDACLQQGNWNFAIRSVKIEYDSSVTPDFGFQRAFVKPSDWLRTVQLSSDEYFRHPMTDPEFSDEQGYWFADIDTIYVRYVSNDASYGYDLSLWPQSFVRYVEAYMAQQLANRLIQNTSQREQLDAKVEELLVTARSRDAMNEGVKFHPQTGWVSARRRGIGRDRGSRSSLIG